MTDNKIIIPSILRSRLTLVAKLVITGMVLYFVSTQLAKNWDEVQQFAWDLNFFLLAGSVLLHLLTFVFFSRVWCVIFKGFGYSVSLRHTFKMAYLANLGRYVPGKIWQVFALSYLGKQIRIEEQVSVASWGVALIVSLPGSFLVSILCLWLYPDLQPTVLSQFPAGIEILAAVLFAISLVLVLVPNSSLAIYNYILKLLKRKPVVFRLRSRDVLIVYLGYAACWVSYGISFWMFVLSLSPTFDLPPLAAIGAFVLAYQIGYLAVFSPGGLGVRELVLSSLLAGYLGPIGLAVAVSSRLWNMIAEILASFIALIIRIGKNVDSHQNER